MRSMDLYFTQKKQDGKSTYQNSGVRFDAHDENGNVQATYYGFIEEILELDYGPLKAALFVEVDEEIYWVQDEIHPLLSHSAHRKI